MKVFNKFVYAVLICAILMSCLVFNASAESPRGSMLIDGKSYTTADLASDQSGKGWKWITSENKLVLNNYNGRHIVYEYVVNGKCELLIELKGKNNIFVSDFDQSINEDTCIRSIGNIKFIGNGSLNLKRNYDPTIRKFTHAIDLLGSMLIDGEVSITFSGFGYAMECIKGLQINRAKSINIENCDAAVYAENYININNIDKLNIIARCCFVMPDAGQVNINSKSQSIYIEGAITNPSEPSLFQDHHCILLDINGYPVSNKDAIKIKYPEYYIIESKYEINQADKSNYLTKLVLTHEQDSSAQVAKSAVPKTGDTQSPVMYGVLLGISLVAMLLLLSKRKKIRNY